MRLTQTMSPASNNLSPSEKRRKKPDLTRLAPPGMPYTAEVALFLIGLSIAFLYSWLFFARLVSAIEGLYLSTPQGTVLNADAVMPDFAELIRGALNGFLLLLPFTLLPALRHFLYFYQDSRSIYLMRRLPSRMELPRRCLSLTLAMMLLSLLTAALLLLLYFGIYFLATPKPCLTSGQWLRLWQSFFHP